MRAVLAGAQPVRRIEIPYKLGTAAAALDRAGQADAARTLAGLARETCRATGERWYEPELLRVSAQLMIEPSGGRARRADAKKIRIPAGDPGRDPRVLQQRKAR